MVEDIKKIVDGCEEGKSDLMGKEGNAPIFYKDTEQTLNPAITLLMFHLTLYPSIRMFWNTAAQLRSIG